VTLRKNAAVGPKKKVLIVCGEPVEEHAAEQEDGSWFLF
jgi:hypothetical protein